MGALDDLRDHARRHVDELVAVVVAIAIAAVSFRRLRYGVDITDEAFYAVLTQRFALGDVPYVDEMNLRQTAGLIPVPFYWLWLKVRGSTDGVIYLLRVVYFGVQCLTGFALYGLARTRLPRSIALIAATFPLVFLPFGIPTCSYNTLGAMFFASGVFFGLRGLLESERGRRNPSAGARPGRLFVGAGLCHALAVVAYPPNAIGVALFPICAVLTPRLFTSSELRREKAGVFVRYAIGAAIVGLPLLVLFVPAIRGHGFRQALSYEPARGGERLAPYYDAVLKLMPGGWQSWLAVLGVAGLYARRSATVRKLAFAGLLGLTAYYFHATQPAYARNGNSLYQSLYLGLTAPFFAAFLDRDNRAKFLFAGFLPSAVAGTCTAIFSGNGGCLNAGLGFFAAASLALVAAPIGARAARLPQVQRVLAVAAVAAIPVATLAVNMTTTYRAGPIATHTAVVRIGPYKGIHSEPRIVAQVEELSREVRRFSGSSRYLLAQGDVPAAYLAAPVKPPIPTGWWLDGKGQLPQLLPIYQRHRTGEGIAVIRPDAYPCRELQAMIERPERLLRDLGWVKIYREPPP